MNTLFIGLAGCGKSLLTYSFGEWVSRNVGLKVSYVNLDPGCESTPYQPDFDIRRLFTLEEVMRAEGLGPHGATVRASELMMERSGEIVESIASLGGDLTLIDTSGQMEVFIFRPTGPELVGKLKKVRPTVSVFIIDPILSSSSSGLVVSIMLGIASQLRLDAPTVMVINKVDLVAGMDLDAMVGSYPKLRRVLRREGGAFTDMALLCSSIVKKLAQPSRVVKTSAKTGFGMDSLYDLIHESRCVCGDLT